MDGRIIFCSDSVLRFQSMMDDNSAYPMTLLQDVIGNGESDPHFLLRFFEHETVIEQGTTLANFFIALGPWAKLLEAYLGKDVDAYIKAVRKPSEVQNDGQEWIGIYRKTDIFRKTESRSFSEFDNINDFFSQKSKPTKQFNIENGFAAAKFKMGDEERYSISGGLNEIKNLPVVLINDEAVGGFLGGKVSLFNKSVSGVHNGEYGSFITGEADFTLREILVGLFNDGLFYYSPQVADDAHEQLLEAVAQLDSLNADQSVAEVEAEIDLPETANENEASKKVVVVPGAFDSVISHFEYEKGAWTQIKKKAKAVKGSPVRIGEIVEAKAPEVRIYGKLIEKS